MHLWRHTLAHSLMCVICDSVNAWVLIDEQFSVRTRARVSMVNDRHVVWHLPTRTTTATPARIDRRIRTRALLCVCVPLKRIENICWFQHYCTGRLSGEARRQKSSVLKNNIFALVRTTVCSMYSTARYMYANSSIDKARQRRQK